MAIRRMSLLTAMIAHCLIVSLPVQGFTPSSFVQRNRADDGYFTSPFHNRVSEKRRASQISLSLSVSAFESSMFLVRIIFLRSLAFIYGVAFTVAYTQNKALIGDTGITPARQVLDQAEIRGRMKRKQRRQWVSDGGLDGKSKNPFQNLPPVKAMKRYVNKNRRVLRLRERLWDRADSMGRPITTILWFVKDRSKLNPWLDNIALSGMVISSLVFLLGAANVPLLLALWICQRSLMAVGGPWYGYGWEPQLAELGFHAIFLVPLLSLQRFDVFLVPPIVVWSVRWHLFRIMMGAGLIKIKGGKEWKDLTAMNYFYETQPVPNPLSRYFHFAPKWWHKWEVITNHFVELVVPFMLLMPFRKLQIVGGTIQLIFQSVLILSGNLSFLNWLTAIPALLCLDDAFVSPLFSSKSVTMAAHASTVASISPYRHVVSVIFGLLMAWLSVPVVRNLFARNQIMNGSFDPLRLVNTYGAFGTVNEVRNELIISSSVDLDGEWKEYEFVVKPGNINRSPRWISPFHFRLDWQMWIAGQFGTVDRSRWMYKFLMKLLENDSSTLRDLRVTSPWGDECPKYIKIDQFRYKFHQSHKKYDTKKPYWDREFVRRWYPRQGVTSMESLKRELDFLA